MTDERSDDDGGTLDAAFTIILVCESYGMNTLKIFEISAGLKLMF